MTDDIDTGLDAIDEADIAAPETPEPEAPYGSLRRDVEEAVGQQRAAKGDPEPFAGLEGRPDTAPGGRYEDLAEFDQTARRNGTTVSAAVRDYWEAEQIVRRDPIQGALHIWTKLGIDPRAAAGELANRFFGPNAGQHVQQMAQQHEYSQANSAISELAPKLEHFNALAPQMAQLITQNRVSREGGHAATLRRAYAAALKQNPTLAAKTAVLARLNSRDPGRSRKSGRR
jgi:hypothetical protein